MAPLLLFFNEFQQNSQVFTDLGRVAYKHEYTQIYIKISSFKSLIYINYFYIFNRNSDTENNSSLFKTFAVDLRRLLCEQVVCLITEKKEYTDHFPFSYIFLWVPVKCETKSKRNWPISFRFGKFRWIPFRCRFAFYRYP